MKRVAIFASGTGSNAQQIMHYFSQNQKIKVALVVSNKKTAPVLEKAKSFGVPIALINRTEFYNTKRIFETLDLHQIDFIVLAGFLWLVPPYLIQKFPNKIVNIHPSLLPKYGGKGMYGMKVHESVWEAQEKESGISIHYVNERYDEGSIIFQAKCNVTKTDTPKDISRKVRELEHQYFAKTIERTILVE